jgi:restriction system protein
MVWFMKFKMAPNSLFAVLLRKPWWVSFVVAAAFALVALALLPVDLKVVGALGALPFLGISVVALVRQWHAPSAREVESVTQAVAAMGWTDFSRALTRAYTTQGYVVRPTEGGADLLLEREGRKCLVAARRWKAARHGEESVQALVDALAREGATEGLYLALGDLSANAQRLVRQHGLRLVQAPELAQVLRGALSSGG